MKPYCVVKYNQRDLMDWHWYEGRGPMPVAGHTAVNNRVYTDLSHIPLDRDAKNRDVHWCDTEDDAIQLAATLAQLNPGKAFVYMKAVASAACGPAPVTLLNISEKGIIPR